MHVSFEVSNINTLTLSLSILHIGGGKTLQNHNGLSAYSRESGFHYAQDISRLNDRLRKI